MNAPLIQDPRGIMRGVPFHRFARGGRHDRPRCPRSRVDSSRDSEDPPGMSVSVVLATAVTAVPEPEVIALVAIAVVSVLVRQIRRLRRVRPARPD